MERRAAMFLRGRLSGLALLLAVQPEAFCADLVARALDAAKQPIKDVVVIARAEGRSPTLAPMKEAIDQIDMEFVPFVKVVTAGSVLSFPNKDHIRHQVYSFSPARQFELPLYVGTPAAPVTFERPGIVTLGCNIHDWMIAYVYVSDSPHFAITGSDGRAALKGLPPGDYVVQVWHPRMEGAESATAQRISVADTAPHEASWSLKLKPDLRPRRAPARGAGGYR